MENAELTPTARAIFGLPSPKERIGGEILRTAQRSIEAFRGDDRRAGDHDGQGGNGPGGDGPRDAEGGK